MNMPFISAVGHHVFFWLATASTIATFMPDSIKRRFGLQRDRRYLTLLIAGLFLYVAFYQAWVDEYSNLQTVISEKANVTSVLVKGDS